MHHPAYDCVCMRESQTYRLLHQYPNNVIYTPTSVEVNCLKKNNIKIYIKYLQSVAVRSHHLQRAHYPCLLKTHLVKIIMVQQCVINSVEMWLHIYRVAQKERMFFFYICLRFLSLVLPQIKSLRSKTSYSRRSESFHSRRNCNCAARNVSKCDAEL